MLVIVILRFLDLFITHIYTPDLGRELNPVISIFGASWTGLIFIQTVLVLLVASGAFFYFNRNETSLDRKDLNYLGFIYFYFSNRLGPWSAQRITHRGLWIRHLVFDGFLITWLVIIISIFAIANNLLLISGWKWYQQFVIAHYKIYMPAVLIFSTIFAINVFFIKEYRRYKRSISAVRTSVFE
jgi:hypothetical protein